MVWKRIKINNEKSKYEISESGDIINTETGKFVSKYMNKKHIKVTLYHGSPLKAHPMYVAVLLLEYFKNIKREPEQVLFYKDRNSYNLNLSNLCYLTKDEIMDLNVSEYFIYCEDGYYRLKNGNLEDERWTHLNKFEYGETPYMISDYGRIRNKYSGEFVWARKPNKGDPYPKTSLEYKTSSGKMNSKSARMHRLVALHFVYNDDPINKWQVHHKDDNKENYHYSNLQWVTPSKNTLYGFETGSNLCYGENSPTSKFTEKDARDVCELISKGLKNSDILKILDVSKDFVKHIRSGKIWTRISKEYDFKNAYKHFVSETDKKIIEDMWLMGKSIDEIQSSINYSFRNIYKIISKTNKPAPKITPDIMVKLYSEGNSISTISELSKVPKNKIEEIILDKCGIILY